MLRVVSGWGVVHRVRTVREHSTVRIIISCAEPRKYVSDIFQAQSNRMKFGRAVESNKGRKRGNAEILDKNKRTRKRKRAGCISVSQIL